MNKMLHAVIRYSGIPHIVREIIQKKRITIFLFHDISPETAELAFRYLTNHYNIFGLAEFITALKTNNFLAIPKKAAIITFDDGHKGNYRLLPIIKQLAMPATIFLCSGIVGTYRGFWFNFDHPNYSVEELKRVSNRTRERLLCEAGFNQLGANEVRQALSYSEIQEMKPFVNFQSHTKFHTILPMCGNKESIDELSESKQDLEDLIGQQIYAISYPNGDYSDRDVENCKQAGYECGITVDFGFNTARSDPFKLKRIPINEFSDLNELIMKSSGILGFFKTRNGKKQPFGYCSTPVE